MSDFFGSPAGKLGEPTENELTNKFANISDRSVEDMAESDRMIPRQMQSGVLRGTQRINNIDGSYITLGEIPNSNGEFGIAFFNAEGTQLMTILANTITATDPTTGKKAALFGILPDGTGGVAGANSGFDVVEDGDWN